MKAANWRRRRDLALAEARHAWDYGTRREFDAAANRAREYETRLNEDEVCTLPGAGAASSAMVEQVALAMIPKGWPSYGPEPSRWGVRR